MNKLGAVTVAFVACAFLIACSVSSATVLGDRSVPEGVPVEVTAALRFMGANDGNYIRWHRDVVETERLGTFLMRAAKLTRCPIGQQNDSATNGRLADSSRQTTPQMPALNPEKRRFSADVLATYFDSQGFPRLELEVIHKALLKDALEIQNGGLRPKTRDEFLATHIRPVKALSVLSAQERAMLVETVSHANMQQALSLYRFLRAYQEFLVESPDGSANYTPDHRHYRLVQLDKYIQRLPNASLINKLLHRERWAKYVTASSLAAADVDDFVALYTSFILITPQQLTASIVLEIENPQRGFLLAVLASPFVRALDEVNTSFFDELESMPDSFSSKALIHQALTVSERPKTKVPITRSFGELANALEASRELGLSDVVSHSFSQLCSLSH